MSAMLQVWKMSEMSEKAILFGLQVYFHGNRTHLRRKDFVQGTATGNRAYLGMRLRIFPLKHQIETTNDVLENQTDERIKPQVLPLISKFGHCSNLI